MKPPTNEHAAAIRGNVERIRARVAEVAVAAGRPADSVLIVGVTKSVDAATAALLRGAGIHDLGENRPEELRAKAADERLRGARWHLVGTYQRRKVAATLPAIDVIHAIDREDLAVTVGRHAASAARRVEALIQVNVSGEATKHGFRPDDARAAFERLRDIEGILWAGLMTIAPAGATDAECRAVFARCRELRDSMADAAAPLPHLSMGMSSDFPAAIAEGATMVRIGTALFALGPGPLDS